MDQLINILIRVSRSTEIVNRCMRSVEDQTYKNIKILIYKDYERKGSLAPYEYNLFCNELKSWVTGGWFFYLDDDDYLASPTVLEEIAIHLTDPEQAIICQFSRRGRSKPTDTAMDNREIIKGRIGMPCIILHSKHKDIADFGATEDADYLFIKEVSEKLPTKFVKIPVVNSPSRGHGV